MRVLVFGGRDFTDRDCVFGVLDYVLADWVVDDGEEQDLTIISGNARGADRLGEEWARENGANVDIYPADWDTYSKAAGHIRNQQMLDSGIDYAVQFPGGRGTADMRSRLDRAGIKVWEVRDLE